VAQQQGTFQHGAHHAQHLAQLPFACCSSSGIFLPEAWPVFAADVWIPQMSVTHTGDGSSLRLLLAWTLPKNINDSDFLAQGWAPEGSGARRVPLLRAGCGGVPAVTLYQPSALQQVFSNCLWIPRHFAFQTELLYRHDKLFSKG